MEGRQSFEDAAFALFQALTPFKQLSREQVPYDQLRELIGDLMRRHGISLAALDAMLSTNSHGRLPIRADERNGGSAVDASDDSASRASFEDHFSQRTKAIVRAAVHERANKKVSPKGPKQVRKMAQTRARRRNAVFTDEFLPLECAEAQLRAQFSPLYTSILNSHTNPVECFHIVVNTLLNYFKHKTWPCNVENLVNEFLASDVVKTSAQLLGQFNENDKKMDDEKRIMEYELHVLLELRVLKGQAGGDLMNTDILRKLNFICFAANADRVRKVLDEYICDLYAQEIPKIIVEIYEDLCVAVPCDLKEYTSADKGDCDGVLGMMTPPKIALVERKVTQAENLNRLLAGDDSDEESSSSRVHSSSADPATATAAAQSQQTARRSARSARLPSRYFHSPKPRDSSQRRSVKTGAKRRLSRRSNPIPETPELMVKKKPAKLADDEDGDEERVAQTPLAKMHTYSSRHSAELKELYRETIKRKAITTAKVAKAAKLRKARLLKGSPRRVINRATFLPTSAEGASPPSVASNSSSHPSVRVNLQHKFSRCVPSTSADTEASTSVPSARSPPPVKAPPSPAKTPTCAAKTPVSSSKAPPSPVGTSPSPKTKYKGDFSIERTVVEKYRRRLDGIRQSVRRADKNEIFYGRCTARRNLFEEEESAESGVSTRAASNATLQKNRSGRSVHTSCVYMAHALLNVHNEEPLSPTKAPKHSPFKMHRLVRPATKSDRRRLSKLRIRIQRERVGLPASILSTPVLHISPTADQAPSTFGSTSNVPTSFMDL